MTDREKLLAAVDSWAIEAASGVRPERVGEMHAALREVIEKFDPLAEDYGEQLEVCHPALRTGAYLDRTALYALLAEQLGVKL